MVGKGCRGQPRGKWLTKIRLYGCYECIEFQNGQCGEYDVCKYESIFCKYNSYAKYCEATAVDFAEALRAMSGGKIKVKKEVKLIVVDTDTGARYKNIHTAAKANGISDKYLSAHLNGLCPSVKGKHFCFEVL